MSKASKKFPKQLIASIEEYENDAPAIVAHEDADDVEIAPGETKHVAVYELKEIRKLVCRVEVRKVGR